MTAVSEDLEPDDATDDELAAWRARRAGRRVWRRLPPTASEVARRQAHRRLVEAGVLVSSEEPR